jgi:elongation factor Tu
MISGASQMDGAILVISSADGTMPQTREHLLLIKQIGIKKLVVFINDKTQDGLDIFATSLLDMEARSNLEEYGFDTKDGQETPIIVGSAKKALEGDKAHEEKIIKLIDAVDEHIQLPVRDYDAPFFMVIESVLTITGRGTVVTGKVSAGTARVGQSLEIIGCKGGPKACKVKSIEMFHQSLEMAEPSQDVGICLNVSGGGDLKREITRGNYLVSPGSISTHKKFTALTYVLKKEEGGRNTPFRSGYRPQFFILGRDFTGTIFLPEGKEVQPGDYLSGMKIELDKEAFITKGENIIIREGNKTIAEAKVEDID